MPTFGLAAMACLGGVGGTAALANNLSATPPMGFLSWEKFRCNLDCARDPRNCISERLYHEQADALVQGGFAAAGYNRVNVDENASSSRASEARATSWLSINIIPRGTTRTTRYMY